MNENFSLLTWMALYRDPDFLETVIRGLEQKTGCSINHIYYLYQRRLESEHSKSQNKLIEVQKIFSENHPEIKLEPLAVKVADPSNPREIIDNLIPVLMKIKKKNLLINTTGGTPAMNTIWASLYTMDFFEDNAKFYSVQKSSPAIINTKHIKPEGDWKTEIQRIIDEGSACEISISRVDNSLGSDITEFDFNHNEFVRKYLRSVNPNPSEGKSRKSVCRKRAYEKLAAYARMKNYPLLILGERGIGKSRAVKDDVANAKGIKDPEKIQTIVCGGLNDDLVESKLFGHKKGSFTGATGDKEGIISMAENGILFMDEIQDLSHESQRKILNVIQDHEYYRVGDAQKTKVKNVQFVFASNHKISDLKKELDPDFFDRISPLVVELPPIRDCSADVEDDWNATWEKACGDDFEDAKSQKLWKYVKEHFSDSKNLSGNYRSLHKVAVRILALDAWEKNNRGLIKDILKEISEEDLKEDCNNSDGLPDLAYFCDHGWDMAEGVFKSKLANWTKDHYGTWEKAAQKLGCNARTLMGCVRRTTVK